MRWEFSIYELQFAISNNDEPELTTNPNLHSASRKSEIRRLRRSNKLT
jgi:hypothetical protein